MFGVHSPFSENAITYLSTQAWTTHQQPYLCSAAPFLLILSGWIMSEIPTTTWIHPISSPDVWSGTERLWAVMTCRWNSQLQVAGAVTGMQKAILQPDRRSKSIIWKKQEHKREKIPNALSVPSFRPSRSLAPFLYWILWETLLYLSFPLYYG